MSDLEPLRLLVRGAVGALERSRQRIDDLNVYPVPDGDTGTNMLLTVENEEQARERLDKGAEAVRTALEMADVFSQLRAAAGAPAP